MAKKKAAAPARRRLNDTPGSTPAPSPSNWPFPRVSPAPPETNPDGTPTHPGTLVGVRGTLNPNPTGPRALPPKPAATPRPKAKSTVAPKAKPAAKTPTGRKPGDRPGGQKRSDLGTQNIGTAATRDRRPQTVKRGSRYSS